MFDYLASIEVPRCEKAPANLLRLVYQQFERNQALDELLLYTPFLEPLANNAAALQEARIPPCAVEVLDVLAKREDLVTRRIHAAPPT
jgi:hypothetical protein